MCLRVFLKEFLLRSYYGYVYILFYCLKEYKSNIAAFICFMILNRPLTKIAIFNKKLENIVRYYYKILENMI